LAKMNIRNTTEADDQRIRQVHEAAFGPGAGRTIADLAVALLHDATASPLISLLAWAESEPVGHVLFTHVSISGPEEPPVAHILAPLAVVPGRQRHGTGVQLVRRGLTVLAEAGCEIVFVLGHPEYYPRFGFQPADRYGFYAPYPIPEKNANAWMVLELRPGVIEKSAGKVQCADVLNAPEHWRE